ncbi:hypothetical protein STEG23_018971, partial [Scotinomys teguina]
LQARDPVTTVHKPTCGDVLPIFFSLCLNPGGSSNSIKGNGKKTPDMRKRYQKQAKTSTQRQRNPGEKDPLARADKEDRRREEKALRNLEKAQESFPEVFILMDEANQADLFVKSVVGFCVECEAVAVDP